MPGDVGDRRHQRDVGAADVVARVAGGHRRDHQLRHADRQRPHRRASRSPCCPSRPRRARRRCGPRRTAAARAPRPPSAIAPTAVAAVGQRAEVGARLGGDLLARDVGLAAARRAAACRRRPRARRRRPARAARAGTRTPRPSCRACRSAGRSAISGTSTASRAPCSRRAQHRVADLGRAVAVLERRPVRRHVAVVADRGQQVVELVHERVLPADRCGPAATSAPRTGGRPRTRARCGSPALPSE